MILYFHNHLGLLCVYLAVWRLTIMTLRYWRNLNAPQRYFHTDSREANEANKPSLGLMTRCSFGFLDLRVTYSCVCTGVVSVKDRHHIIGTNVILLLSSSSSSVRTSPITASRPSSTSALRCLWPKWPWIRTTGPTPWTTSWTSPQWWVRWAFLSDRTWTTQRPAGPAEEPSEGFTGLSSMDSHQNEV